MKVKYFTMAINRITKEQIGKEYIVEIDDEYQNEYNARGIALQLFYKDFNKTIDTDFYIDSVKL